MQFSEFLILQRSSLTIAQSSTSEVRSEPSNSTPSLLGQDMILLIIPICFVAIWAAVVCMISDTWKLNRKQMNQTKQQAQLPCKKCHFFQNNPYIKCAVNPGLALTKEAMECSDYQPRDRKISSLGRKK
jgi:hypothetical protein